MTSTAAFTENVETLRRAGVGVILCRTREPFRAIEALRDLSLAERLPFMVWTVSSGWATYSLSNPNEDPKADGNVEPIAALRHLNSGKVPDSSLCVMMYPHRPLTSNIVMIQIVKEYCRNFVQNGKRLVMITPTDWDIPIELENDLAIVELDSPSKEELSVVTADLFKQVSGPANALPDFDNGSLERIVNSGAGMTVHEYENALSRAIIVNRKNLAGVSPEALSSVVMDAKAEAIRKTNVLELMPVEGVENVGGLENLKSYIYERRDCFTEEAAAFGIDTPKGCALIGPPGTGKSASAKAIASVLGLPALRLDTGRLFSGLVGSTEARTRSVLKLVESIAPCVLFMDEADKQFAGQANGQSGGDSGVSMRVLGSILTFMQESKAPVYWVVTANRVEGLPPEFLRPGRLDDVFYVGLPNATERKEIVNIHLRKRKQDPSTIQGLDAVIESSDGYVPAEIELAIKNAIIGAFQTKDTLTGSMIVEQLKLKVPISSAFKEQFDHMSEWAKTNARPASRPDILELGGVAPMRVRGRESRLDAG